MSRIGNHEHVALETDSGRTIHLWLHECDNCVSLDVWTDRGREVEAISRESGDTTRAAVGAFTISTGSRSILNTGLKPLPETRKYPPMSTVVLVWNDNEATQGGE